MSIRHALSVLALLLASANASACSIRMTTEPWLPYIYRDADGQLTGLDYDLTRAIMKEAGCALVLLAEVPVRRRDLLFKEGKVDLIMAASITPERLKFARFSAAYRTESVGLFAVPEKWERYRHVTGFQTIADGNTALLAPHDGWYGADYARWADTLKSKGLVRTFGSFEQGIQMLGAGRSELIMGDGLAVLHAARQARMRLVALPYSVLRAPVHLMFNAASTSAADIKKIDAAIARLEKRGALKAIRDSYLN